jgi:hypothetical protein
MTLAMPRPPEMDRPAPPGRTDAAGIEPLAVTARQIGAMLGMTYRPARRLIVELEANYGLRRKGGGAGTRYDRQEFLRAWHAYDTRT